MSGAKFIREHGDVGAAPVLKVNSRTYSAGGIPSLLRYAGHIGNLYPVDAAGALAVDEALAMVTAKKPDFAAMDKLFASSKGPFLLGAEMSVADIAVLCLPVERIAKFESIRAAADAARVDPRVAPHIAK